MRYWKRIRPDKTTYTVEAYSYSLDVDGAMEITEKEFNAYIASLPVVEPEPVRDLEAEIDELKAGINDIKDSLASLTRG